MTLRSVPRPEEFEGLTQFDLEPLGCSSPGCTHDHSKLFFHGACHPSKPVQASYDKLTGVLSITCSHCNRGIAQIKVEKGGEIMMSEVTRDPEPPEEEDKDEEGAEGEGEDAAEGSGESEPKASE